MDANSPTIPVTNPVPNIARRHIFSPRHSRYHHYGEYPHPGRRFNAR
jgi:hypothetical protein